MILLRFSRLLPGLFCLFFFSTAEAEPWMANRFAENCASCHSPGRRDVAGRDRRCTLSCQSCHSSPSGGGLRTHHGLWTQQRWLRSKKGPDILKPKGVPAPLRFQKYAKMPAPLDDAAKKEYAPMARDGARLVVLPKTNYPERPFHPSADDAHKTRVQSEIEFMARIPDVDPLRTERESHWSVGADFKYLIVSGKRDFDGPSNQADRDLDYKVPQTFDIGVRYRPVPKKIQLVFEHRYFNPLPPEGASRSDIMWSTDGSSINRSAYVLFDELPYNTHFMYGNYQPMFGHKSSDPYTLRSNYITSQESDEYSTLNFYDAVNVFRAASFGSAIGSTFYNIHWIKPRRNPNPGGALSTEPASAEGFAANAGLHLRKLGASLLLSFWSTEAQPPGSQKIVREMMSLSAGKQLGRWTLNFDSVEVDREQSEKHKGQVQTFEGRYRFFRENYALASYAIANTSRNLKKGDSSEWIVGAESYYNPGVKFEALYITRDDRNGDTADQAKSSQLQLQAHISF